MSHVAEHCRWGEPNIGYLGVLSRCHFSHNIVFQNVSRESRHKMTGLVPKILVTAPTESQVLFMLRGPQKTGKWLSGSDRELLNTRYL